MLSFLIVVLAFVSCADEDSLLFRVKSEFWYPLDKCFTSGFFNLVDQKLTLENKKLILTQCSHNTSCSSDCEKMFEIDYTTKEYVPNVLKGENWLMAAMYPNLRILEEKSPTSLGEHQYAMVSFVSKESCENNDFSDIAQLVYSNEDATLMNEECMNIGGSWGDSGPEPTSIKCSCDANTHSFSCLTYNTSDCSGTPEITSTPCSDSSYSKQYCGSMDFTNGIDGLSVDMSNDVYFKAGTYPDEYNTSDIFTIANNKLTMKQCNAEKTSCLTNANQEFEMNVNKPVQSLMLFFTAFGGTFYAYDTKPLEIEKGASGGTDEMTTGDGDGSNYQSYAYKVSQYYGCESMQTKECLANGSVLVTSYSDNFCKNDPTTSISSGVICGTLPVNNNDINTKNWPAWATILISVGGGVGVLSLLIILCAILIIVLVVGVIIAKLVLSKKGTGYEKV